MLRRVLWYAELQNAAGALYAAAHWMSQLCHKALICRLRPPCSIMMAAGIRRQRLSARDWAIKALLDEFSAACAQVCRGFSSCGGVVQSAALQPVRNPAAMGSCGCVLGRPACQGVRQQ